MRTKLIQDSRAEGLIALDPDATLNQEQPEQKSVFRLQLEKPDWCIGMSVLDYHSMYAPTESLLVFAPPP
jgi:hypothetical protein